ncbi:hypothetical protein BDFG_08487 [Blastomyces dermatitidis ATCC 26199]|nr:hypothetical protein BDFG_08487 [Blastomyces dermatitidis ATCC 26199]
MGSYATVLTGRGGGVATVVKGTGNELDMDTPAGRRNDTSLQGMATSTAAAREAGGGVTMRAVLPRLIDITISNLTFLTVMEAAAAPQRHLSTRKHQNKPLIILQE